MNGYGKLVEWYWQRKQQYFDKINACPSTNLFTINAMRTGRRSNTGLCLDRPVTACLSDGRCVKLICIWVRVIRQNVGRSETCTWHRVYIARVQGEGQMKSENLWPVRTYTLTLQTLTGSMRTTGFNPSMSAPVHTCWAVAVVWTLASSFRFVVLTSSTCSQQVSRLFIFTWSHSDTHHSR
jgi:hypothetical protein